MTKSDIINQIAESTGCKKKEIKEIVDACFSLIAHHVENGDEIYIHHFGSFYKEKGRVRFSPFC